MFDWIPALRRTVAASLRRAMGPWSRIADSGDMRGDMVQRPRPGRSMGAMGRLGLERSGNLGGAASLLLAVAACGQQAPPLSVAPRLSSIPLGEAPQVPTPLAVLEFSQARFARGEGQVQGADLALVSAEGLVQFRLPEFAGKESLLVRMELSARPGLELRVALANAERPLEIAGPVRSEGAVGRQWIELSLPALGAADDFWLAWAAAPRESLVHRIELLRVLPWQQVPQGLDWYDAAGEQRLALGLTGFASCAIEGEWDMATGTELALALPAASDVDAAVVVEVLSGGEIVAQLKPDPGGVWTNFQVRAPAPLELRLRGGSEHAAVAVAAPRTPKPASQPRRVLLITSDTHRGDHLGQDPDNVGVHTPVLDALAQKGTLFSDAWVTTHITNPSHVALLTATHPRDTGIVDNRTLLGADAPTLAEVFRSAGFRTWAAVSASHLLPSRSGLGQGFERFAGPAVGQGESFDAVARALAWLDEELQEDTFLWVHVFDAHAPYTVSAEELAPYWPAQKDPKDPQLARPASVPPWARDVRDLGYLAALYRAEVSHVDLRLAPLLEHGSLAQAWIAFTADHGETLGVSDGEFDHRRLDPANLRVPLVLVGPGVEAGTTVDESVATLDLGRSLLDLAGLGDREFPGRSLLGREGAGVARFALARNSGAAALVQGDWMLVFQLAEPETTPGSRASRRHQVLLFDIGRDAACRTDLAESDRERARPMRKALQRWLGQARDLGWAQGGAAPGAAEAEELAALGYASGGVLLGDLDLDCDCAECSGW